MPILTLPPYDTFAALRLHQFLPAAEIEPLENWEYLGHYWVGEGDGFTTMVQLESEPDRTRAVEIALRDLPEDAALAMLRAVGLPLRRGMSASEAREVLGTPTERHAFVPDRATEEFVTGSPPYHVSCTCLHNGGLIFVTMHVPLPPGHD